MDAQKERFIKALAKYLAGDDALKSMRLQAGIPSAKEWGELRAAVPCLHGYYPDITEAEKELADFLSGGWA